MIHFKTFSRETCWKILTQKLLRKSISFEQFLRLYKWIYPGWRETAAPAWFPNKKTIATTNLARFMRKMHFKDYSKLQAWSAANYPEFWGLMVKQFPIVLNKPYQQIVELSEGIEKPQWLSGAKLNIVDSCFTADSSRVAILYQSEEDNSLNRMTYGELDRLSNQIANSLINRLNIGDTVAMVMSMTPKAVATYLGIIKAGGCVVPVAESFSTNEIKTRFKIADIKMVFTQFKMFRHAIDLPIYEKLLPIEELPPTVILDLPKDYRKTRVQDMSWNHFLSDKTEYKAIACDPNAPITILFSSGTTGSPKAIPWTHTTPIKSASDAYFHHDLQADDVFCWPTSLGWMMGPWLVFATLINQSCMALYDGIPVGKKFGEFVQDAKITQLGVVPTLVKNWRTQRCMENLDWKRIKLFTSTGECSNIEDMLYLMWLGQNKPIIEYCGGTEIGGAYISGTLVEPAAPAALTTKALGNDFLILDDEGLVSQKGEVALIPPCVGLSNDLFNGDHHAVYYAGMPKTLLNRVLRRHGDEIVQLKNGFYRLLGRIDDTMNLGGIKVSAVEIERVLLQLNEIKEAAALGMIPKEGGPTSLIVYVVLLTEVSDIQALQCKMQQAIKNFLNPLFKIKEIVVVEALPKTASNKIMRRLLLKQYEEHC